MNRAFVALGSNLKEPKQQVLRGIAEIMQLPHCEFVAHSSLYQTSPVGYDNQPDFINAVIELNTKLNPLALLNAILAIEDKHGRERPFPNAPRVLDCDLLWYNNMGMNTPTLTLPHPRMHVRGFVMVPLAEIAPDLYLPGHGKASDIASRLQQGITKLNTFTQ